MRAHVAVLGDAFVDIFLPVSGNKLPFWGGDVLLEGAGVALKPGGSAANTASHLASLARSSSSSSSSECETETLQDKNSTTFEVSLHTALGHDEWATMLEKRHAETGMELVATRIADAPTGVCIVISGDEDRAFMTQSGSMAKLTTEMLDMAKLRRAKHLHIGGFFSVPKLQAGLADLVRELRATTPELTVSLDTNYDASETWGRDGTGYLDALLGEVDVFLPNETEACAIADTEDIREAAQNLCLRLRSPGGAAIVTNGAEGCLVAEKTMGNETNVQVHTVPGARVSSIVDATGAGDAFNAAFLHAWISGASLTEAASKGVLGGTVAILHEGACDTLLTPWLMERLAENVQDSEEGEQ